jgi:acetyl-CoA carboxylase biotin carboxyl carrier protein
VNLSNEDVQDILRLLDTLPYDELTLETGGLTLRLRRSAAGDWTQETQVLSGQADGASGAAQTPDAGGAGEVTAGRPGLAAPAEGVCEVLAPLLGTFYRAPQPGAAPFVDIGSRVEADTVVAIIETMKLMNPVYAGTAGTVSEICLDDGQFAQRDAVLMRVRAG